ncbi:Protein of unknown function [Propionibacterium freudenreichii]|nr:Protein of unknown function [Propionibacterium freudenreichii subsp. freudenreichii]CEG86980.1 Protein of unknown function [Propionibacterium freudenreichii]CEG88819.1 Protein of unknown function [Propionibacterium freudenreichii]CEG99236.1 Protein of unknown function [Propionibacterium freudenreichii]CEH01544.1 Protein of unknown function [Propionibacterium freudenreichii]
MGPPRAASAWSWARATTPAVDARRTASDRLTSRAPAPRKASSSSGLMPPSGPITKTHSPADGTLSPDSGVVASSCSTRARSARARRSTTPGVPAVETCGIRKRRDCLVAARADERHLARPFSALASQRTMLREACQAMISSTPSSVMASTAISERSPLASAWTATVCSAAGLRAISSPTRTETEFLATESMTPRRPAPAPSATRTDSPTRMRFTVAA